MPNYGNKTYWDERYKAQKNTVFDWLESYKTLQPLLDTLVDPGHRILNIGCGNGQLTEEMYDSGYTNIWNMDISQVVIEQMLERNHHRPGMRWEIGDVFDMNYENEFFDVVIDKSKLLV